MCQFLRWVLSVLGEFFGCFLCKKKSLAQIQGKAKLLFIPLQIEDQFESEFLALSINFTFKLFCNIIGLIIKY